MDKALNKNIQKTVLLIHRSEKVLVASHINPDGDTLGCLLALGLSLIQTGKRVVLLSQDGVPARFQFLPGSELIVTRTTQTPDVSIAVDCGSAAQLGRSREVFFKAKTTIQIDHHDFGEAFGKIQILDKEASAVGEIVYDLIRGLKAEITPAIATCLLTSIIIDTGAFRFSNIRPKTFDICRRLIQQGIDLQHLIEESYWKKTRSMAKLSAYCLLHSRFSPDGQVAWATVIQKDFKRFKAKLSDADAVADELRSVEGVKIAALFRETENKSFRVSLRSRYGINVAAVAKRFGGGGHHNSAGCLIPNSEKEKQHLLKELVTLVG